MLRSSFHNTITIIHRAEDELYVTTHWRGEKPLETRYSVNHEGALQDAADLQALYGTATVYEGAS